MQPHSFFCPGSQESAVELFDSCLQQKEISARDYTFLLHSEINLVGAPVLSMAYAG